MVAMTVVAMMILTTRISVRLTLKSGNNRIELHVGTNASVRTETRPESQNLIRLLSQRDNHHFLRHYAWPQPLQSHQPTQVTTMT